jgi:1-acyl-sn-glycerol-3-phosphate acyltransferase
MEAVLHLPSLDIPKEGILPANGNAMRPVFELDERQSLRADGQTEMPRVVPLQPFDGANRYRASEEQAGSVLDGFWRQYDADSLDNRNERFIDAFVSKVTPLIRRYFKGTVRGIERIPRGAGLYVGNHNGGGLMPDSYLFGSAVYEQRGIEDCPFTLAHDIVVRWPLFQQFFIPFGAVRACPENAHRICRAGKKLLVYPGGDAEANRPFRDRNRIVFGARRGYLRLALRENVPIIPVVAHGAHSTAVIVDDCKWLVEKLGLGRKFRVNAWPITISFPWGLTLGPPPPYVPYPSRIRVEVLEPIRFDRHGAAAADDEQYVQACHEQVVSTMQTALDRLAHESEEEGSTLSRLFHRFKA